MIQMLLEEFLRDYRDYKRIMNPYEYYISKMVGWVRSNADSLDCSGEDDIFDAFEQMAKEAATKDPESILAYPDYWDGEIPGIPEFRKFCRWNRSPAETIPSGFTSLDRITGGFRPGELTVIGARPSVGKSAFLRSIIRSLSIDGSNPNMDVPLPVAYFTPSQTSFQLSLWLIWEFIERGAGDEDIRTSRWKLKKCDKAPLHIDDTPDISARDFRSRAERLVKKKGVRLIAVDYLQRMRGPKGSRKSHKVEISAVVRCLKETAAELNVPVIALSGLVWNNNGYYSRPRTGDLEYAPDAIEENADVVCLMWRRDESAGSETVVSVVKNKNGQTGDIRFNYNPVESFSFIEIVGQ